MSQRNHNTSFYIETLLLILVFITVILLISQVFALGKNESGKAGMLTDAVTLAQNAAEAVSASSNVRELAELLDENGNVSIDGDIIEVRYGEDMLPSAVGEIVMDIGWFTEKTNGGTFVTCPITVKNSRSGSEIFSMETGVYISEGTA